MGTGSSIQQAKKFSTFFGDLQVLDDMSTVLLSAPNNACLFILFTLFSNIFGDVQCEGEVRHPSEYYS